jgi:hypothetical protein
MSYILREICRINRENNGSSVPINAIEKYFKISQDPKFLNLNLRDLFRGSGLLDIIGNSFILTD